MWLEKEVRTMKFSTFLPEFKMMRIFESTTEILYGQISIKILRIIQGYEISTKLGGLRLCPKTPVILSLKAAF
jgi:hypothetical protein